MSSNKVGLIFSSVRMCARGGISAKRLSTSYTHLENFVRMRRMELAQDRGQRQALELQAMNYLILLPIALKMPKLKYLSGS
jgi:hypothetical protein